MQARLLSWFNGLAAKWKALERRQKIAIIVAFSSVVIFLGVLIFWLANPPKYAVLSDGANVLEVMDLKASLDERGVWNEVAKNGLNLYVREKDIYIARAEIATLNLASQQGFTYEDAIASSGMGTSRKIIDQNLIEALKTDMVQGLRAFENVLDAKVYLSVPSSSNYYMSSGEKSQCSAQIETSRAGAVSRAQGEAMARMLSKSAPNLSLEDIFITDQYGSVVFSGEITEDNRFDAQKEYEAAARAQIINGATSMLSMIYKDVYVSTHLSIDMTAVTEEALRYVNPYDEESQTGLISTENRITSSSTNTVPEGEPGLETNDLTIPNYVTGTGENAETSYREGNISYVYDVIKTTSERGRIGEIISDDSGLSAIVSNPRIYRQDYYERYPDLLQGMTWEQFKENNSNNIRLEVDNDLVRALALSTGISLDNIAVMAYEVPVFEDTVVQPLQVSQIVMYVLTGLFTLLLAYGLLKRAKPDEVADVEPELSVEGLLVSTQLEEEKEKEIEEAQRLREIEYGQDSEIKKQIEKFVEERPEAVAQLLRNWINEDWE